VNYGLRWEPYLAPKDKNGYVIGWTREDFDNGFRSTVYPNAPLGLKYKGDPGFPDNNANSNNQLNQFAPRFGLVLDPQGDGRQTIRTGFGIYYDSPKLWTTAHHMLNAPFGNTADAIVPTSCPGKPTRNGCPIDFLDPWSSTPGGDPMEAANFPKQGEPVRLPPSNVAFPLNAGYVVMPVDAKPMTSYQYNVAYQRQLADQVMIDVTYTGNQQRHIWIPGYAENPAVYIPGNCAPGQFPGVTAAAPACSNTSAANRQARSVLTLLNPDQGKYYGFNTGDGVDGWRRSLQRPQARPPEAHELGMERERQLHDQQVHQSRGTRHRHRLESRGGPDGTGLQGRAQLWSRDRSVQQRSPALVQPELGAPQPGNGHWLREYAHEGLAGRVHFPGAQRFAAHAGLDRRSCAHR
jgi:hypothetical protein